jgi:drug/metabolite transporter (DMT)-like permease
MAIIACLLWSSAFAGIKIGLQYTTPLHFAGVRFLLAGLLVLPFCGHPFICIDLARRYFPIILTVAFFQTTLLYTFFYLGLNLLPGAVAAIIIGTQPLMIAMVAHLSSRAERMTTHKAISIGLGVIGVTIIALDRGDFSVSGGMELLGMGLLLLSNLSAAISNLMVAKRTRDIPPLLLNSTQLILGGILLLILSAFVESGSDSNYPAEYYFSLAWLSSLSAAAISIWFILLRKEGVLVSDLNIWKFLIPLSGACLSWLLIGNESPDPASIIGMVLIAMALAVLNFRKSARYSGKETHPLVD